MKELTDREKLLISSVIINKQDRFPMAIEERADAIKEYSKSLLVFDKLELYEDIRAEFEQLRDFIKSINFGETANYDGALTDLSNREKYIYYNVEMCFIEELPFEVLVAIKSAFQTMLGIKDDLKILELVTQQFNDTVDYLEYLHKV